MTKLPQALKFKRYSARALCAPNNPAVIVFCDCCWGLLMHRLSVALIATVSAVFFTQIASAADMPVKASVYKAPVFVPYNWTGLYLGVHGGCGWANTPSPTNYAVDGAEDLGVFSSAQASGCFGGGQIGYNYQFSNRVVVGIEVDAAFANIGSTFLWNQPPNDPFGDINNWQSKLKSFGTVRARLGYAYDHWLPYITGGWAWGRNRLTSTCPDSCDAFGDPSTTSDTRTHSGWVVGGGLEYAINKNWSMKVEYLHLDLGSARYNVQVDYDDGVPPGTDFGHLKIDTVKLGVNYRPDWGR